MKIHKLIKFFLFDVSLKISPILALLVVREIVGVSSISEFMVGCVFASFVACISNMSLGDRNSNPKFLKSTNYIVFYFIYCTFFSFFICYFFDSSHQFFRGLYSVLIISSPYGLLNFLSINKKQTWLYVAFKSIFLNLMPVFNPTSFFLLIVFIYAFDVFFYKTNNQMVVRVSSVILETFESLKFSFPILLALACELIFMDYLSTPELIFYANLILRVTKSIQQTIINYNVFGYGLTLFFFEVLVAVTLVLLSLFATYSFLHFTSSQAILLAIAQAAILTLYVIYNHGVKKSFVNGSLSS